MRLRVHLVSDHRLEELIVDDTIALRQAGFGQKPPNGARGKPSAAKPLKRRHSGVVPTGYDTGPNQFAQDPFAHHRVAEVKPGEFILMRAMRDADVIQEPIVQRAVILELQRAHRVRDPFDRVFVSMCEIVHRVDAPLVFRAIVGFFQDPIHNRVSHIHIRMRHIDFGSQHTAFLFLLSRAHSFEEAEILLDRSVSKWRVLTRFGQRAARETYLFRGLVVHIGFPRANQFERPLIKLIEIVGGIAQLVPLAAQPTNIFYDGAHELLFLFLGIRIVKPQVEPAPEGLREPVIQSHRFRVTDMQIAVRLGRKPGHHLLNTPGLQIVVYDLLYKIHTG